MWGTVIVDTYSADEKAEVADALEALCSPSDTAGWSSAGIYIFWQPRPRRLLYMGLAGDLPVRFAQHNGLASCKPQDCKVREIDSYFKESGERLGYSILALSPLAQTAVSRNKARFSHADELYKGEYLEWVNVLQSETRDQIEEIEGGLIEGYRLRHDNLPPWNKIGGSIRGRPGATARNDLLKIVAAVQDSLLIARYPLREIAGNETLERYETFIHVARMQAVAKSGGHLDNGAILAELERVEDSLGTFREIVDSRYTARSVLWTLPEYGGQDGL
jgi:hypothetical protein